MVVADEEFDAGEPALLEAGEEVAPVDLGLAGRWPPWRTFS